jgi:rhodanese-related sulfurtransferase
MADDLPNRTLEDIRAEVAAHLAVRASKKAITIDNVKLGVIQTLSQSILQTVAEEISQLIMFQEHIFAVYFAMSTEYSNVLIFGSSSILVDRAVLLMSSKFLSRIEEASTSPSGNSWSAYISTDPGENIHITLEDVLQKAARTPSDPLRPPPNSYGVDDLLAIARRKLSRLPPRNAFEELVDPTHPLPVILVDIRPAYQRDRFGAIAGAMLIERVDLEFRFDPRSPRRVSIADRYDLRVIVLDQYGDASSLAAAALHKIGLENATDVIGGYAAWKADRLPSQVPSADTSSSVTSSIHARSHAFTD